MWIRNKKHIKKTRRFQTMKNASRSNRKLEAITYKTIVVGIDIAKSRQWARFVESTSLNRAHTRVRPYNKTIAILIQSGADVFFK